MDVKDLCLGALTYGDATGYDLKKFFENTFGHCFLAGYGSIYPALAELTAEKLVTARMVPGQAGPSRKLYHLTEVGRRRFLARLGTMEPQHRVKSEFLVLIHFAHLLPPERLNQVLDRHLQEIEEKLMLMQACESGTADDKLPSPGARFAFGFGKAMMTAAREYIRTHRHSLTSGGNGTNPSTKPARPRKTAQATSRTRGYPNA